MADAKVLVGRRFPGELSQALDRRAPWRREIAPIAGLVVLGLVAVLLIDPRGNFPLNDDWCYAKAVRHLLEEGEIRLTDWGSMSLLTQVLWGSAFSLLLGFSFETLRASTLVLGLAALLACYGLARTLGASRGLAFLATLVLLGNPLFLVLSHTFMTDVPFLAFSTAAVFLLARGIERDSWRTIAVGLLCALAATFVRQLGLAVFTGFALAWLSCDRSTVRRWIVALAPLASAFTLLRIYESWLAGRNALPANYYLHWRLIAEDLRAGVAGMLERWLITGLEIAIYLGLFALPIAAVWLLRPLRDGWRGRVAVLATATVATLVLGLQGRLMPYFANILLDLECDVPRIVLGPLTLQDGCRAADPGLGSLSPLHRWILTWLGMTGAGAVIGCWVEGWQRARRASTTSAARSQWILLLATAGSYFALIALLEVFDRYLLFLIPLVLAMTAWSLRDRPARAPAHAVAAALAAFSLLWSVGALQEYLDWNRARWRAIAHLAVDQQGRRGEIDGGFEFGGWLNFDSRFRNDRRATSWWWVADDRYAVSFAEIEGWEVIARFPYRGWFGSVEDDVLALRRSAGGS